MEKPVLDPSSNYVVVTGARYAGHDLPANHAAKFVEEPTAPGEFTIEQAQQLLDAGKLQLASDVRPTPVEKPEDEVERLTEMEAMGEDKFLIRAPWLGEGEVVAGADEAKARYAEVRDAGLETYRSVEAVAAKTLSGPNAGAVASNTLAGADGFGIVEAGSNGYYEVVAPGREPEKVRGKTNAEDRLAALRIEIAAEGQIEPPAE